MTDKIHADMPMRPLVLVGGGGHCRSVIEAARSAGLTVRGIIDLPGRVGEECLGVKITGSDADIARYAADCDFIVTLGSVGDASGRIALHGLIAEAGGRLGSVVASTAHVSDFASVGPGTVILHRATVNAAATIGQGCIINTAANIEHDAVIADYCHISTGAMVNGGCRIGRGAFIGSGAVICQGVSVAAGAVVGAGAVVCRDIDERGTYAGVPAKRIK